MKNFERLIWIGVILMVLSFAFWDQLALNRSSDEFADQLKQTSVEAHCGIAAGGALSSDEVSITCGLDDTGVAAVIARAVNKFDLPELVAQVQERSTNLPTELDEMALRLGLTREAMIDVLSRLSGDGLASTVTPERLAATITRSEPRLVLNVTSTVSKAKHMISGEGDSAPPDSSVEYSRRDRTPATDIQQAERIILKESKRLQVECGVVAGKDVAMGTAHITCGPKEEDIDAIVNRVIGQSNVDALVDELRRGALAHTELVSTMEEELKLSRTTVLQLLKRIADANLPRGRAANELTTLTKKHVSLTYQLGQLPKDNPGASKLRDVVAAALGASEFTVAEMLLMQWSQLQQSNKKLEAMGKKLAEVQQEREIIAGRPEDQRKQHASGDGETPVAAMPEKTPSKGGQQAQGREAEAVFIRQDRVVLDSPPSAAAGTVIRFAWRGPAAPDDLIIIAKIDLADNKYPTSNMRRHKVSQGSPAVLIVPAEPEIYEIRYLSYSNAEPLARVPLKVTEAEISLSTPPSVSAGSVIEFDWRGPAAPDDLIFIVKNDVAEDRYPTTDRQRHKVSQGSPATLVAPADQGDYEIRYYSYYNGKILSRKPLAVRAAEVKLLVPDTVNPGAHIKFPWHGPNAPGDLIFFLKPDRPRNEYITTNRHRHRTSDGPVAELVAPAKPGPYEIRYFSYANGAALSVQSVTVE